MYYLRKADETEAAEKLRSFLRQDSSDVLLLALHIISVTPPQPPSERARDHNTYPGAPIWRLCRVWLEQSSRQGARNRVKQSFLSSEELFLSGEFGNCLASVLGSFPEAKPGLSLILRGKHGFCIKKDLHWFWGKLLKHIFAFSLAWRGYPRTGPSPTFL